MVKDKKTAIDTEQEFSGQPDETRIDITGPEDDTGTPESKEDSDEVQGSDVADNDSDQTPALTEEETLRAKVIELEDKLLRSMADLENFKKRSNRQFDQIVRSANDKLFGELLDISDNLDRALAHFGEKTDAESVRQGTRMIANQFHDLISRYNIVVVKSVGEKFDSSRHEALMTVASDEFPEGTVALEIGKGYMIDDRVLRFAKVGVSKGPELEANNENNNSNSK